MQEIAGFFKSLFSTNDWPPRWVCGHWTNFHGWLYIVSDLLIFLSYFLIPIIIMNYFRLKNKVIRNPGIYLLFAFFIVLCGTTHLLDAAMFWVPAYRINTLFRLATAIVSLLTVYHLFKMLPLMMSGKTRNELEVDIAERMAVEKNLHEANTRLSAFAAVASHDLQEPLRKIQTYASRIKMQTADTPSMQNAEDTGKIIECAARMQVLIKDVLTLSSIAETITLDPIDPALAVRAVLANLDLVIAEKKAVIEVGTLPVIQGNTAYLTQLFSNLITNALKFNEGIPRIQIRGEILKGLVMLSVTDNGIGLQPKYYEKIFEAFQRGNSRTKYSGTGIGLAICATIMKIHMGTITVESVPGEGSTFLMVFPHPYQYSTAGITSM